MLADLKDLHDVGMLQPRDRLGFNAEARQARRPRVDAGQDHLQRDDTVSLHLPRLVDNPHPALTEDVEDLVAGHARQDSRFGPYAHRRLRLGNSGYVVDGRRTLFERRRQRVNGR